MTDKEIIKVLNTATNIDSLQICCIDYENNPETKTFLSIKSDIVDLINRQQAEIEKQKNNCKKCGAKTRTCIENLQNNIAEKQAEIERLQKHSKKVLETCSRVTKANDERNNEIFQGAIEVVRAEAIKEFIEEFTSRLEDYKHHDYKAHENFVYESAIEHLVNYLKKEMVGEQE